MTKMTAVKWLQMARKLPESLDLHRSTMCRPGELAVGLFAVHFDHRIELG